MPYPIQSEPTDWLQAEKARAAGWKVDYPKAPTQTQDCKRGEHLLVTGRRSCPLCGEDY